MNTMHGNNPYENWDYFRLHKYSQDLGKSKHGIDRKVKKRVDNILRVKIEEKVEFDTMFENVLLRGHRNLFIIEILETCIENDFLVFYIKNHEKYKDFCNVLALFFEKTIQQIETELSRNPFVTYPGNILPKELYELFIFCSQFDIHYDAHEIKRRIEKLIDQYNVPFDYIKNID